MADAMGASGAIGMEQAKVYALRDVYGYGRAETADLLGKSPNTVDNLLATARQRVVEARQLIDVFEGRSGLVRVRRSRSKTWHRERSDPRACRSAASVQIRQPADYRVLPESEVGPLSGDLCGECFER